MNDIAFASCILLLAVAYVVVPRFSPYCDHDEFADRMVPLQRQLYEGVPIFKDAPPVQTAGLEKVMSRGTGRDLAQVPEVDEVLGRKLAGYHLPFVLRNVSSIAALHRRWTRQYLTGEAGGTPMLINTYRDKRAQYVNFEPLEAMRKETPDLAETLMAREDYPADHPDQTLAWLFQHHNDSALNHGRVYAMKKDDDDFIDEPLVQEAFDFSDSILDERWSRGKSSEFRLGFRELHYGMHLDFLPNFMAQVAGTKHVVLIHPLEEGRVPWERNARHPQFRQSSIWPRDIFGDPTAVSFSDIQALQVTLSPGDVVFIPPIWMHYIESFPHDAAPPAAAPHAAPPGSPPFWITLNQWATELYPTRMQCPPRALRDIFSTF